MNRGEVLARILFVVGAILALLGELDLAVAAIAVGLAV
jgi:hypothetical protein